MVRACKSLLSSVGQSLTALSFEESVADKVLSTCQRVQESTCVVVDRCGSETGWPRPMLQLVSDVSLLASHTTLWTSLHPALGTSSWLRDLTARAADQVKAIGHQSTSMLQGCEGKLSSLVVESGQRVTGACLALCRTCGELALATECHVLRLDHSHARGLGSVWLSEAVSQSFLSGCGQFAETTLRGALQSLDVCEGKCLRWRPAETDEGAVGGQWCEETPQRVRHVLACVRGLLHKTMDTQRQAGRWMDGVTGSSMTSSSSGREENDGEEEEGGDNGHQPPQYYSATYKRLQAVVGQVTALVDSCSLLVESAEPLVRGQGHDSKRLERCADLIQKSSQRLLAASSYTYTNSPSQSLSSSAAPLLSSSSSSSLSSSSAKSFLNTAQHPRAQTTVSSSESTSPIAWSQRGSKSSASSLGDTSGVTSTPSTASSKHSNNNSNNNSNTNTTSTSSSTPSSSSERSVSAGDTSQLTDVSLLSESQLSMLDAACQEVTLATSMFAEFARKTWSTSGGGAAERGRVTPRGGKRLLPVSPEKAVVTPAVSAAQLRKLNMVRTIALAGHQGRET
ncbi:mucin-21 [Aplysia californica]|uniref:Mucin-21 n=1 Tax=Aplysia californica TaxID=6500 RepID=A0ABM1AF58_APLCA|nr:mucin-21 [Aplysia californica]